MKRILLPLAAVTLATNLSLAGNWFGSGPWANGTYYPGQLDGRYFANVYNNLGGTFTRVSTTNSFFTTNQVTTTVVSNSIPETISTNIVTGPLLETNTVVLGSVVSGVIGFGIRDGAAPFVNASTVAVGAQGVSGTANSSSALQSLSLDRSLNNFVVYINGDAYVGTTVANINPSSSTVSGVLANGAGRTLYQLFTNQAAGTFAVANVGVEVISIPSATASGYFNANVNNNKATYTFNGSGTIAIASASGNISEVDGTHNFQLDGIKTSGNPASAFPQTSGAVNPQ
jgi:hypothetical protein